MQADEILAQRIQNGDTTALAPLIQRHHNALIGYLYRMCGGNRSLAEDLAQESFLRMMQAIHQYTYPRSFKSWLYAIATNLVRDHFKRAEMRYVTVDITDVSATLPSSLPRPETLLEANEEITQLLDALMRLSELHRAVIVLRYYEEMPLQEIAETLDIPLGTVKSRISKGLVKLRNLMQKELTDDTHSS